jgi:hypothetical protein
MRVLEGVAIVVAGMAVWYAFSLESCIRRRKEGLLLLILAALVFAPVLVSGQASAPAGGLASAPARGQASAPAGGLSRVLAGGAGPLGAGFPDLVNDLKTTPGCLGVEPVGAASGKRAIFAWFEDKRALMRWYSSEAHLRAVQAVFPGHQLGGTTLKDLADDTGPILAIASITPLDAAQTGEGGPPVKQISIEYYIPLAGGIAVGGRFAPAGVKVPGMREIPFPAAAGPRE